MTKTFDDFSAKITETIFDRIALFTHLGERPDVKDLIAVNEELLAMFTLSDSILENHDEVSVDDLEKRISDMIETYYQRLNQGSSNVVGVSQAQKAYEELIDLTHVVSPMFEKAEWRKFYLDLPNDKVTRTVFENSKDDDLIVVMTCIIVLIKSNMLSLRILNMAKKPQRGARTHEPIVSG